MTDLQTGSKCPENNRHSAPIWNKGFYDFSSRFEIQIFYCFTPFTKNRQWMTACSLPRPCYYSVNNWGWNKDTRNYPQTKDKCNHALWWTKQIYFSTELYFHSTSSEIKDISSCISCYTPEQYTIKRFNIAAIRNLICFSRLLNLHSTPGLALSIEIIAPRSDSWLSWKRSFATRRL